MVLWHISHHKMLPVEEAVLSHNPRAEAFLLLQPEDKFPCLYYTPESVELAGEEDNHNNFPPHIPLYNLGDQDDDDDDFLEGHPFVALHNRVLVVPDRNHLSCTFLLLGVAVEVGYDVLLVRDHNYRTDVLNLTVRVDGGVRLLQQLLVGPVHHCSGVVLLVPLLLKMSAPSQLWFPLWNPPSLLDVLAPRYWVLSLLLFGYDLRDQMI